VEYQVVNLYQLQQLEETEIGPEVLHARGLIGHAQRPIKVLGTGDLKRSITVSAHKFSRAAREKIEGLGGRAEELA
jgi:large subunit ribosomal protein L15